MEEWHMKVTIVHKRKSGEVTEEVTRVSREGTHTWEDLQRHPAIATGMPSQGSQCRRGSRPGRND